MRHSEDSYDEQSRCDDVRSLTGVSMTPKTRCAPFPFSGSPLHDRLPRGVEKDQPVVFEVVADALAIRQRRPGRWLSIPGPGFRGDLDRAEAAGG
jgi:hypothetical protein